MFHKSQRGLISQVIGKLLTPIHLTISLVKTQIHPVMIYPVQELRLGIDMKVKVKSLSHVGLSVITRTLAYQAPPSMGFSRQEYWSGFPFPSPGNLPNPGIKPRSPTLQADTLPCESPACYRYNQVLILGASQVALVVKNLPAIQKVGWIPRSRRASRTGNDNPLTYYCLENPWTEEPGGL